MSNNKKINLKAAMLQGKQLAQALPAAQEATPVQEPVAAPAPVVLTETKRALTLARNDERNFMKAETFTVQNENLKLLDAVIGGGFIADRIEWLMKLGLAADIAYRVKTGDILARSNTEGFHGSVHSDLMAIFEDPEAVAQVEAYFNWAKENA